MPSPHPSGLAQGDRDASVESQYCDSRGEEPLKPIERLLAVFIGIIFLAAVASLMVRPGDDSDPIAGDPTVTMSPTGDATTPPPVTPTDTETADPTPTDTETVDPTPTDVETTPAEEEPDEGTLPGEDDGDDGDETDESASEDEGVADLPRTGVQRLAGGAVILLLLSAAITTFVVRRRSAP